MDDTPCNIHVSIFTKCGKWSVTRVTTANFGAIHSSAQELLGSTVKQFRKKVATDVIEAGPVSVGSLRLESSRNEFNMPISGDDFSEEEMDPESETKALDLRLRTV